MEQAKSTVFPLPAPCSLLPAPDPVLAAVDDLNRYRPFEPAPYQPADREVRHMVHLVAYDISSPARLRRVARTCEDFGVRVELSVFECDLEENVFDQFWKELNALIDPDEDSLLAYRLCLGCVRETLSAGAVVRPGKMLLYLP